MYKILCCETTYPPRTGQQQHKHSGTAFFIVLLKNKSIAHTFTIIFDFTSEVNDSLYFFLLLDKYILTPLRSSNPFTSQFFSQHKKYLFPDINLSGKRYDNDSVFLNSYRTKSTFFVPNVSSASFKPIQEILESLVITRITERCPRRSCSKPAQPSWWHSRTRCRTRRRPSRSCRSERCRHRRRRWRCGDRR